MTKHFLFHLFSIVVCLAVSNFQKFGNCHSGEKVDGIVKLKKYFNHLGFIPNSPSNFTNDFDDDLKSAIRTYQINYNLNVTGELDDQTLRHVERPRCGNPDIVNGITTMNSGKKPTSEEFNGAKLHTVAHYTYLSGMAWGRRDLKYAFDNKLPDEVKQQLVVKAFKVWSDVSWFKFTLTTSSKSADIKIGFYDDGVGGFNGALARAFGPPDGRLHINTAYKWSLDGKFSSFDEEAFDLLTVLVHETGHVLGLGHSYVENSLMYPIYEPWTRNIVPVSDDVLGIQTLDESITSPSASTPKSSPAVWIQEYLVPISVPDRAGGDHGARSCWELGVLLAVCFLLL